MTSKYLHATDGRKRTKREQVNKAFNKMIRASYPDLTPFYGYEGYDVILIIPGREEYDATRQYAVGISSVVLAIASPVFDAMLNGSFAEGQMTVDGRRVFTLLEDDIVHVRMLCDVLYHCSKIIIRPEWGEISPAVQDVCGLLALADKYDCIAAVRAICTTFCGMQVDEPEDDYNSEEEDGLDCVDPAHDVDDYKTMAYTIMISYVLQDLSLIHI